MIESDLFTSNNSTYMSQAVELAGEKKECLHLRLNYCHAKEARSPSTLQDGADKERNQTHIVLTNSPMKAVPKVLRISRTAEPVIST